MRGTYLCKKGQKIGPLSTPKKGKDIGHKQATVKMITTRQNTNEILEEAPSNLGYLSGNLEINEEDKSREVLSSEETITLVSDGGRKDKGGFGWVAA